ncbi:MAG: extracellular solute-binding protein [Pyrinomonadaceae bacterium]|jgi:iron(III) transport system substrate-binding protein|nr:extracellular solute-binding protein [Pyrinomonadaceae bacterium]MBA3571968.1 extracellular solute-binding protein [Pyrinomonadaceae bacterium]
MDRPKPLVLAICIALIFAACGGRQATTGNSQTSGSLNEVTIYVSTDRVFSEPILRAYEQKTGVKVNAVYDTEETKSTGLANKLLAEKNRPQADVFWSNEPVRTLVLKKRGVLAPYRSASADGIPATFKDPENYWTGFSARSRVIVYNTKLVKPEDAPKSVLDLDDPKWKDQVAMADPRFGTTSFHVAALYAELGDERADEFFRKLKANGVKIVSANSVVLDTVARGEAKVGITDTDDVNVGLVNKQPVAMVFPDREGMGVPVMPNMVSLIAGAPHPDAGKKLIDYLLSPEVERMLSQSEAVQIPLHAGVEGPKNIPPLSSFKPMTLDYGKAADRVEDVTRRLQPVLGL